MTRLNLTGIRETSTSKRLSTHLSPKPRDVSTKPPVHNIQTDLEEKWTTDKIIANLPKHAYIQDHRTCINAPESIGQKLGRFEGQHKTKDPYHQSCDVTFRDEQCSCRVVEL